MKRDPHYRDILTGLSGPLDPDAFEACAADLLRRIYPGLVPVPGGNDAGFDGAIADPERPTHGLVCTTSQDPVRNLQMSLESQRSNGYEGDSVVFATPRKVTPATRRKLEQVAANHGYTILQVYEQTAIANLLFESPAWCEELLGLTGAPTALSVAPVTSRPLRQMSLVGRDDDVAWLRGTSGDRLLIGQPGSGKTAVLYQLAREGWGLFLVDDDRERIANAVRAERPRVVVVDDAHVRPERLRQLQQLREQIGAEFDIVATCWTGSDIPVQSILQLPRSHVRELPLLRRDQMVDVVNGCGLGGPDVLIGTIVTQADGRPGLAVTLTNLCLRGDVEEVIRGDAIARNIGELLAASNWGEDYRLIAAFAAGGDAGMPQDAIGNWLGLARLELARRIADLAFAGIVRVVPHRGQDDTYIAVEPPALRASLVRDAFFRGPGTFDIWSLADLAPSGAAFAQTLVDALASGANIDRRQLLSYLDLANSGPVWKSYASLGRGEAEWVLRNRPALTLAIADPALHHAPESAIPALLELAQDDARPTAQHPDHPLRQIEDWIHSAHPWYPAGGSAVERRRALIRCGAEWLRQGGDRRVGVRVLMLGLDPEFRSHSVDPGLGRTITFTQGTLPDDDLAALAKLWLEVRAAIASTTEPSWPDVLDGIGKWAFPPRWQQGPLPEESQAFMRATASAMLRDVVAAADGNRGALQQTHSLAQRARLDIDVPLDSVFFALYGDYDDYDDRDRQRAEAQASEGLDRLVKRWSEQDPIQVAEELASLEREATAAGITYPRRTEALANRLAVAVKEQTPWLRALVAAGLGPEVVLPFLHRATNAGEKSWEVSIADVLERPDLVSAGVHVVLTTPNPPQSLLNQALDHVPSCAQMVKWLAMRQSIPLPTLSRLLQHPDAAVAGEAAYGEWMSEPRDSVRPEIAGEWRAAVLRDPEEYHQVVILEAHPELGRDWLCHRLQASERLWFYDSRDPTAIALDATDRDERRSIMALLSNETADPKFVARLIGNDASLYRELLGIEMLSWVHTAPLMGELNAAWSEKARVALKHGMVPEQIAGETLVQFGVFNGSHSSVLAERLAELEQFAVGQDPAISRILEIAIDTQKARLSRQLAEEHHEAVHGFR